MTVDPKTKLAGRLKRCLEIGRLTVADLQHFFRRPYPTVRTWIKKGAMPRDPKTPQLLADLAKLEKLVQRHKANLVPFDVLFVDRPAYMAKLNGHRQSASATRKARRTSKPKRKSTAKRARTAKRAAPKRQRKPARPKARKSDGDRNRQVGRDSEPAVATE